MAVNFNEENIKDAINNGIGAEAVNLTLGDMMDKIEQNGVTPKQVKEVIETIVDMKKDTNNVVDEKYASDFVQKNNEKLKSAINDGVTSKEVTKTLVESTKNAKDKESRKHLRVMTKLISKLKVKELRKENENQMEKGRQKVLK